MVTDDPEGAWSVTLEILARCDERDLPSVGAGPAEDLILRQPAAMVGRYEKWINSNPRFRQAFTYVGMGGVPLAVQRRLSAALVRNGVDPETIVEFDEDIPI